MRFIQAIAAVSLVGTIAAAIAVIVGNTEAESLVFVLGCIAVATGFTAMVDRLGRWGMPGDGH
jgi:hypothetical protein